VGFALSGKQKIAVGDQRGGVVNFSFSLAGSAERK
jgi:hypothetical protein